MSELTKKYLNELWVEVNKMDKNYIKSKIKFIMPEEDGAQDELEDYLNSFEEISSIQMSFVTRL